jgi:uncharacterized protein with HEPN domain
MMQFVVIGEIISRLDENFKTSHSEIPWQKIKDFRNIKPPTKYLNYAIISAWKKEMQEH